MAVNLRRLHEYVARTDIIGQEFREEFDRIYGYLSEVDGDRIKAGAITRAHLSSALLAELDWLNAQVRALTGATDVEPIPTVAAGTYVGNGADSRTIAVGFEPDVVVTHGVGRDPCYKTKDMSGANSYLYNGNVQVAGIQALTETGFTVANGGGVNTNGVTYYWWAFKTGA